MFSHTPTCFNYLRFNPKFTRGFTFKCDIPASVTSSKYFLAPATLISHNSKKVEALFKAAIFTPKCARNKHEGEICKSEVYIKRLAFEANTAIVNAMDGTAQPQVKHQKKGR